MAWGGVARLVLRILLADAAFVGALLLAGWAFGWPRSAAADVAGFVGLAAIAWGGIAASGAWQSRDEYVGFAASVGPGSLADRTRHAARDVSGAYRWLLWMLLFGVPLVAFAFWWAGW